MTLLFVYFQFKEQFVKITMADNYHSDTIGNMNDKPSYVVGIPLSPSATLYVDHPPDHRNILPPTDFGAHKKKTTSFQITSVTVQGSRLNNDGDCGDDSADDLDESHAEDLSSDILDSSKATDFDAEHSDENSNALCDDLSPCSGPIIITKLPSNRNEPTINVGLSIGVSPAFPAVGPNVVSSGVTMMTSNTTTPVSAQVPIINPLPDHWQHRFKVVKLVSSEPFKRGRWLCMDFVDPPAVHQEAKQEINEKGDHSVISPKSQCAPNSKLIDQPPVDNTVAHVYEIPVNQSYPGSISLTVGTQQQPQPLYGIILPVSNQGSQITMVQNVGIQTTTAENTNVAVSHPQHQHQSVQTSTAQLSQPLQVTSDTVPFNVSSQQNHVTQPLTTPFPIQQQMPCMPISQQCNQPSLVNSIPENAQHPLQNANGHDPSFSVPSQVPLSTNNGDGAGSKMASALSPTPLLEVLPDKLGGKISNIDIEDTESSQTTEKITAAEAGRDSDPARGSASTGTSTVAIDNKIEQAMDLVKSHLMFAVREEVEVLKEKITELLERISQLEQENGILRANASPETLSQLTQSQKKVQGQSAHQPPQQVAPPHPQPQPSSS